MAAGKKIKATFTSGASDLVWVGLDCMNAEHEHERIRSMG
jgi:hypothetical protein